MLFRNRLKELVIALDLTKQLENELIKDGATGNSFSDKIKSYQKYDKEEFIKLYKRNFNDEFSKSNTKEELSYKFREYKRSLLDGRYNDLRWVAHERNQIMHCPNYTIGDFSKFQSVSKDAIEYFQKIKQKTNIFSKIINFLLIIVIFIGLLGILYFLWHFLGEYIDSLVESFKSENWIIFVFRSGLGIIILYTMVQILIIIGYSIVFSLSLFFGIYFLFIELLSRYWFFLLLLVLSYFLWDKDVSYLKDIQIKSLKIWELF